MKVFLVTNENTTEANQVAIFGFCNSFKLAKGRVEVVLKRLANKMLPITKRICVPVIKSETHIKLYLLILIGTPTQHI